MTAKQKEAWRCLERTLKGIDTESFWRRVMEKHAKHCDAMDEVRRKSLEKAGTKVLR